MPLPAYLDNPIDRARLAELQQFNQKHIERADESYKDLGTIKIFNVGAESHVVSMGGLGLFTIPACPSNRIYSEPLEIWKLFPEGYNVDMTKMKEDLINGYAIAEGIVAYGKFSHPSSDRRRHGAFTCGAWATIQVEGREPEIILASEVKAYQKKAGGSKICKVINVRQVTKAAIDAARKHGDQRDESEIREDILAANLPTEAEIGEAHRHFREHDLQLVAEANDYYRNNFLLEIQKPHRAAAIRTNNHDLPWVKTSLIMQKCGVCGNSILPDVAICMGCKSIVPGKEHVVIERRVPGYEAYWQKKEEPTESRKKA